MSDDWDRLVTVLTKETVSSVGGTSQGSIQNTVHSAQDGAYVSWEGDGDFDLPPINYPADEGSAGGISTMFITMRENG